MTQTQPASDAPAKPFRRRGNRLYMAIWCLLGCGAAAYLVMTATGMQFSLDGLALWTQAGSESGEEQGTATTVTLRQSAETPAGGNSNDRWVRISRDIADLKSNVATISSNVAQVRMVQQESVQRVARLEAWRGLVTNDSAEQTGTVPATSVSQSSSAVTAGQKTSLAQTTVTQTGTAIEGTTLDGVTRTSDGFPGPVASDDEAILAALLGNRIDGTNGELAGTPAPLSVSLTPDKPKKTVEQPRPIAAVVPLPGRRAFGVELASGDSVDSLRLSWALLNERHRDLLGRLAPRFVQSGTGTNEVYRLIAGPFTSSTGARQLCTQLKAYYVPCQASAFTGSVL